jgi:hypothetical protein
MLDLNQSIMSNMGLKKSFAIVRLGNTYTSWGWSGFEGEFASGKDGI